jgi:uncharacterized protein YggE
MEEPMESRGVLGSRQLKLTVVTLVLSIIALGVTQGARAQTPTSEVAFPATVSVSGRGSVIVEPDTASVVIGVTVLEPTLSAAQEKATTQMNAVIEAIKAAGVEEKDIQTVSYSVDIIQDYDQQGNPITIRGFRVSNQVSVTVRDIERLGELLDRVVAQGANTIYGISFFVADPATAATQARTLAVQDAMDKAKQLAAAAGLTVDRVVSITETSYVPPTPVFAGDMGRAAAEAAVPIQAGTQTVSVDVQMVFELR